MSFILRSADFFCGTSNVELPVAKKSLFPAEYQDKSRLSYYSSLFNTVEINSSFYKIPQKKTVERWASEVADDFLFTFKLWRGITHTRELQYQQSDVVRFMNVINGVGNKKGCLLIQLPASIKFSLFRNVRKLLDDISSVSDIREWKIAIEFRDRSWYNDIVYEILERSKVSIVVHDMPASRTPLIDMETSFSYFRFHGEKGDYKGNYDHDDVLEDCAVEIKHQIQSGRSVFAYFNNTIGSAVANATTLYKLAAA